MSSQPQTEWAIADDGAHIAYQVVGSGPVDVVFMVAAAGNAEADWDWAPLARFLRQLASFSRLIRFDPRGSGMSDPNALDPTLERQTKDLMAVLDRVGSTRTALVANNLAGLWAMYCAAAYPERISALVLDGCYARLARADDMPWAVPEEVLQSHLADSAQAYGTGFAMDFLAPSYRSDPEFVAGWGRRTRLTVSPAMGLAMARAAMETDVRGLLGTIQAPTLVLCRRDDPFTGPNHARYLAEHIAGAKLVELPGADNLSFVGDTEVLLGEIEEFLTGERRQPELDRVLATVLFTDIVESTRTIAEIGDHRWRELLDLHDEAAQAAIERFRGRFVKSTGDGILAIFDGPARAIRCAEAITDRAARVGLGVRAGLHTGEIELRGTDVLGLAVHLAQRVCAHADEGEILVTRTVVDLVAGSALDFEDTGTHQLKGIPGPNQLFRVSG